jgi:two-component system LytT family response regulator
MINVLIIEDETPAAKRLEKMVQHLLPAAQIHCCISSVKEGIEWFMQNAEPHLVFSDIQLSDGTSFEIFASVKPKCPVIFTTAYDQYALDAFKLNSIDYLLKPIKQSELQIAIEKFNERRSPVLPDINKLLQSYAAPMYKQRFVIKYGEHIKTIPIEETMYFYTEDKVNFLTTTDGRRYVIDFNLDSLETMLDPKIFFRINRQFIISIHAISEMLAHSKSRVYIKLKPSCKLETIVSTERSAAFKTWLGN